MFIFSKLLSFIFFGANLVPKSEVLQTDQNLVQGYINYYALISMLMFIFSKKVSFIQFWANFIPKSEVSPISQLESRICRKFAPSYMNDKTFEKISINIEISIW